MNGESEMEEGSIKVERVCANSYRISYAGHVILISRDAINVESLGSQAVLTLQDNI